VDPILINAKGDHAIQKGVVGIDALLNAKDARVVPFILGQGLTDIQDVYYDI
jgi:hypothetical protein